MNALANLMNPAAVGASVGESFQAGRKQGREMRLEKALAAVAANPDDQAAIQEVLALDHKTGAELLKAHEARQFNRAAVDYYRGGAQAPQPAMPGPMGQPQNALLGSALQPAPPPQGSQANALAQGLMPPVQPGASFDEAFAPMATPPAVDGMGGDVSAAAQAQPQDAGPDFSALGQPQTRQDEAFLKMLSIDAKQAFAIDSEMRDRAADRLKLQRDAYGYAVSRLGGVADPAGYKAALADIAARIEPLGVEITDHLPAEFPGPDGIKQLRLGAIDAKDQVSLFLREADIEADNERADRNTDSLIETREGRLAEQRRATDRRIETTRRGQDLTDKRVRSGGKARPTATDANGRKVEWNGKAWVPVK